MVSASFHGSPPSKGGSFWAWRVCEVPVKRWLCVLRSRAHCGQNSSVTPTELGLCSTADGRESGGRKHRSSMFGCWLGATHHLGAQGTGSQRGEVNRPVCAYLHQQTQAQLQRCCKGTSQYMYKEFKKTRAILLRFRVSTCDLSRIIIITFTIQSPHIKTFPYFRTI